MGGYSSISMFKKLLVPLDGSSFAEQALPWATSIARRAGARLELVRVHVLYALQDPTCAWMAFDPQEDTRLMRLERAYLDAVAKRIESSSPVPVIGSLVEGGAAEELVQRANNEAIDLVVMTTHGRGPWGRFWIGSVADEVVRRSSVPLLLIRPPQAGAASSHEPVVHHILVPLDGSSLAAQGLKLARAIGKLMDARFTLLSVIEPIFLPGYDPTGFDLTGSDQERMEKARAQAQNYLNRAADDLQADGFQVQTIVKVGEKAAKAILDEAGKQNVDLIGLATHGRGGLKRAFLGSVADKIVRGAAMPVLLCRNTKE